MTHISFLLATRSFIDEIFLYFYVFHSLHLNMCIFVLFFVGCALCSKNTFFFSIYSIQANKMRVQNVLRKYDDMYQLPRHTQFFVTTLEILFQILQYSCTTHELETLVFLQQFFSKNIEYEFIRIHGP